MDRVPWRRYTARALPVRPDGRVLLLRGFDPARPDRMLWFTVGGAMEDGESPAEAAARELHEEACIEVAATDFGPALETSTVEFAFGRYDIVQDQTFLPVRVDQAIRVSFDCMEAIEAETTVGYHWWTGEELEASGELHPDGLPEVLRKAAAPW